MRKQIDIEETANKLNELEDSDIIEIPKNMKEAKLLKTIDIVELANKLHDIIQCRSIIIEEPMLTWDSNNTHTRVVLSREVFIQKMVNGKKEFAINSVFCEPITLPIKVTDKEGTHRDPWHICHRFDFY